ncbi:MAG: TatD family hydrolase [Lachnospiraceae bacterium]|nr:TatD family hydrolase [Ruminococcus sp.]MCM1275160.1 TatD family hydrolase [Lachnospiraceae bacterium]
MGGIFDTHAHYMKSDFGEDLDKLLAELPSKNVARVLAVGCDIPSSTEEAALAERYGYIYAAAGIHPEYAADAPEGWERELEGLLAREKVVALGEIGLDYHYPEPPRGVQRGVFVRQLEMAKRLDMPVIIHSRDACADTMDILRQYKPRGVLHCFSGSAETAREVVRLGMYIGFTGVLTFKNSKKACAACEAVPIDRLLLETDCPYMAPVPHRGERCDSSMIAFTAAKMAEIKGVSTEEMIDVARENGERLFFK